MKTSPTKSKPAKTKAKAAKTGGIDDYDIVIETPADQQIAALQNALAKQKDKRLEERFYLGGALSLVTLIALSTTVAAPLWALIIPVYLGFLTIAAKKCGVDEVVVLLNTVSAKFTKETKNIEDKSTDSDG